MTDVEIDVEAAEAARNAFLSVLDTIGAQYAQHNQTAMSIEGLLSSAASAVFEEMSLNPLSTLDPFNVWERWGFGGIAQSCSNTQSALDYARSTAVQIVNELCDAHRGQLAPLLLNRASIVQSSLDNALNSLWSITSLLSPGNILSLIENPWSIMEHFSASQSALNWALCAGQEYTAFLTGLGAKESALIDEITLLLTMPPAVVLAIQGIDAASVGMGEDPELESILRSPLVEESGQILGYLATLAGEIPHLSGPMAGLGFAADAIQGGKYDPHTLASKAGGATIGVGINAVPIAGEIYDGLAVGSASMGLVSLGLQGQEQLFQGQSRSQLNELHSEWSTESHDINPGALSDDLGAVAFDLIGGTIQSDTNGAVDPEIGGFGNLRGDLSSTAKDSGSLLWGLANVESLGINTATVEADVLARSSHAPVWLQSLQGPLDWAAGPGKSEIDIVASAVLGGF